MLTLAPAPQQKTTAAASPRAGWPTVQLKPTADQLPVPTPTMPTACAPRHYHRSAAADPATQDTGPSGGSTGDTWMRAQRGACMPHAGF